MSWVEGERLLGCVGLHRDFDHFEWIHDDRFGYSSKEASQGECLQEIIENKTGQGLKYCKITYDRSWLVRAEEENRLYCSKQTNFVARLGVSARIGGRIPFQ